MVYLPAGGPGGDQAAVSALDYHRGPNRNCEFQLKWERIIREWSLRWGRKVDGWWFDGCYWPNAMYRSPEPPNFASFAAAARAGNPDSAVAFNPGVVDRILSITPYEDYSAGEMSDLDRLMVRRATGHKVDGAQIHILTFLGQRWGMGTPRFSTDQITKWSRDIRHKGGVITWDTPIQKNGLLAPEFIEQLKAIGAAMNSD